MNEVSVQVQDRVHNLDAARAEAEKAGMEAGGPVLNHHHGNRRRFAPTTG
jgi:hypothetical protein